MINEALTKYKMRYCEAGTRNLQQTVRTAHPNFWESALVITRYNETVVEWTHYNKSLLV